MKLISTLAFVLCLASLPASAATYYVAPTGNDAITCVGSQNINTPRRNIAVAVTCLAPGDTLFMRAGTYIDNLIDSARFKVPSGTSWTSAITIAGYPGELVTLQPPNGLHGIRLTLTAPSYLIFQDFVVDMVSSTTSTPEGVYLSNGAHHNRFQRLEVKNAKSFGFAFSRNNGNSPFHQVLNCKIHRTGNNSGDPRNGHGIYLSTSDNLIENNEIYDNQGAGIHGYDDTGPKYVNRNVIRGNTIRNNGLNGGGAYAVVAAWGDDALIEKNAIHDNHGGVMVYTGSGRAIVRNNVITRNKLDGVALQYYSSAPTVKDNNVYGNGQGIMNYGGTGTPIVTGNVLTAVGPVVPPVPPSIDAGQVAIASAIEALTRMIAELRALQVPVP